MADFANIIVCFLDSQEKILLEKKLTALPLDEELIKAKSLEFYHDPEPCMIRRSAVMKRLFLELQEFFLKNTEISWAEFPPEFKRYLDIRCSVQKLVVKRKQ